MWVVKLDHATPALYLQAANGFFSWTDNVGSALKFSDKASADGVGEIIVEATTSAQA